LPTYRRSEFLNLAEPDLTIAPFRILFAGRIERNKGVFDLLAIAQRLIGEGHNLVFELCGDGTALQELREAAQKAGLSQTFLCHGYCQKQKLQERLSRSHLVIVPTRTEFVEGFNQVVAEGVLAGRPVITSSVCPAIAYVQEAVVEVPPNDVQAYGDAVLKLYRDRDFYQLKRRNCAKVQAQFYDSSYSWATTLHSLLLEIFPQRAVEPDPKLSISASSRL
jgi:glycogen synthase